MTDSETLAALAESVAAQAATHADPEARLVHLAKVTYNQIPEREKRRLAPAVLPKPVREQRFRSDLAYTIFRRSAECLAAQAERAPAL